MDKQLLSPLVINENFLELLSRYVKVRKIPVAPKEELKKYFKGLEKYRLDYLYVDSLEALLEAFLLREKLRLDIPFIVTLHTVLPWASQYAYMIPLLRKYDIILTPSKYARESFLRISQKIKVEVIPNCLDIKYIQRNILNDSRLKPKKTITFMGRLTEKKGIGVLIKCMPELIKKIGEVRLNIIGPLSGSRISDLPKNKYIKRLERKVKRLGLTESINFMGVRLGLEKYKALSEADVFVSPTLAEEENFPIANIEALACGLPVITTNWAGNKELIRNGKNGYLIEVHNDKKGKPYVNTGELGSLIARVLKNPQFNLSLRREAAKTAQRYDYRRILPRLSYLLKKKKTKEQNRWDLIKNKGVGHFNALFNRDFLFFICATNPRIKRETYSEVYQRVIEHKPFKIKAKKRLRIRGINSKQALSYKRIMAKLSRDYKNFLSLRDKTA